MTAHGIRTSAAIAALSALVAIGVATAVSAAESAERPPGMEKHQDPGGIVSIELPRGTTDVGPDPKDDRMLQRWGLNWNETPGDPYVYVYVRSVPEYANAVLCGYARGHDRYGYLVDGSVVVEDGTYMELRKSEERGLFRHRVVARDGHVYEAMGQARRDVWEKVGPQIDLILKTFEIVGTPTPPQPPSGFVESEVEGCRIWSDAKKRDVQRVAKEFRKAWDLVSEALPGEPMMKEPPLLVICDEDASFEALWHGKTGAPEFATVDRNLRATIVRLSARRDADFAQAVYRNAALHGVRAYFGGPPPPWVEDGLRMYVAETVLRNGKFDQPIAETIKTAREAAQRRNALLTDIFELEAANPVDRNNRDRELYAWHWFFRHGPGREKYGDLYDAHMRTLRETGDVGAARANWEKADMEVMRSEFIEWIGKWHK